MPDFATRLAALGISPPAWHRWVESAAGRKIPRSTTHRHISGEREPSAHALALLAVIENPKLIERIER